MEPLRELERVGAVNGRAVLQLERLDVGLQGREREPMDLDEVRGRGAARQRLEAQRPRAREQVEHARSPDRPLEDREPRLAHAVGGGAGAIADGRLEPASSEFAGDHANETQPYPTP